MPGDDLEAEFARSPLSLPLGQDPNEPRWARIRFNLLALDLLVAMAAAAASVALVLKGGWRIPLGVVGVALMVATVVAAVTAYRRKATGRLFAAFAVTAAWTVLLNYSAPTT
jgi:FtsH-binding integral membrane protein